MENSETLNYPEGRNLLKGKAVVITAAAGSGIGFATAKDALKKEQEFCYQILTKID